ncbi:MAG: PilN domain-containing protein [Synechococcales cyanobacterium]
MYTPEINLLKDRSLPPTPTGAMPIPQERGGNTSGGIVAIAFGVLTAGIAVGAVVFFQISLSNQLATLTRDRDAVVAQVTSTQDEVQRLRVVETEFNTIKARIDTFKSFFNDIQPWSAILEDLRSRVPRDVWINSMSVSGNQVTLSGVSLTFEQVNDFQLTLLQSPFVQSVTLASSQQTRGNETRLDSVSYSFQVGLRPLTLASDEVLQTLSQNGSEGLVAKVGILRNLEIQ